MHCTHKVARNAKRDFPFWGKNSFCRTFLFRAVFSYIDVRRFPSYPFTTPFAFVLTYFVGGSGGINSTFYFCNRSESIIQRKSHQIYSTFFRNSFSRTHSHPFLPTHTHSLTHTHFLQFYAH